MLALLVTSMIVAGMLAPVSKGERTFLPPRILSGSFNIESVLKAISASLSNATRPLSFNSTVASVDTTSSAPETGGTLHDNTQHASPTNTSPSPSADTPTSDTHDHSSHDHSTHDHSTHDHSTMTNNNNPSAPENSPSTNNHATHASTTNPAAQNSTGLSSHTQEADPTPAPAPGDPSSSGSHSGHDHGDGHDHDHSTHVHISGADSGMLVDWDGQSDHDMPPIVDQHGHIFDRGQIDAAVRDAIMKWLARRRGFRLQCVIKEDCVFAATEPADRFSTLEKERWLDTERSKEDPCEGQEKSSNCCTAASRDPDFVRGFNRRIREQSQDVARICKLLCTQGRDSTCYLSCDLSSWLFLCAKPTSTSPKPTADDDDNDDDDDSSTTPPSQSLTDDDEEGPNVTVIVVSCLAAFLAGITGAILITWFLRRRKSTKERGGEAPSDNTSTTVVSGQHTVYEELPEGTLYQKQSVKSSRPERISSENEYTYIPDHQTASRTTSSSYNVPGDHLANRKLPSAPAQPHGTGNGTSARRAEAGTRPENYSLARDPGGASRKYFELEKNEEQAPANGQYFILEKQAREGTAGDDYYSALKRDGAGAEEEYSALDQEPTDGAYTREYLELVPDYLLQKPVD